MTNLYCMEPLVESRVPAPSRASAKPKGVARVRAEPVRGPSLPFVGGNVLSPTYQKGPIRL